MSTMEEKDFIVYTKSEIARLQRWLRATTHEFNVIKNSQDLSEEKENLRNLIHELYERIEDHKMDLQVYTGGHRL